MNEIKGLPNIGNSCYLDSVLFCLFLTENSFIQKNILNSKKSYIECQTKIQSKSLLNELKTVFKLMIKSFENKEEQTCQSVKTVISKYRKTCPILMKYSNFSNGSQHESLEFLQMIATIFGLNGLKNIGSQIEFWKRYGVFTKSHKNVRWFDPFIRNDKKASFIYFVDHTIFKSSPKSIKKYLASDTKTFDIEAKYKKCLVNCSQEKISVVKFSDLFVVALDRASPFTQEIIHSKVTINQTLTSLDGKTLHIDSIIIHLGHDTSSGHYIAFKRYKNKWFLYDDLKTSLRIFDSWKEVTKYHTNLVSTHGILYFYSYNS